VQRAFGVGHWTGANASLTCSPHIYQGQTFTLPDFTLSVHFLCPPGADHGCSAHIGMMEILAGSAAAPTIRLEFRAGSARNRSRGAKR
jgi:hypothetical protein